MALIESIHLDIGTQMPAFQLSDPFHETHSLDSLRGEKGTFILFTCNHCPYAIAIWPQIVEISHKINELGISTCAINSNINPSYPDDAPDKMIEKISEWNIDFPYLVDETQSIAQQYQAQCTPDLYLLDANDRLVYHGRIEELETAVQSLITGKPPLDTQHASIGCSIKWLEN